MVGWSFLATLNHSRQVTQAARFGIHVCAHPHNVPKCSMSACVCVFNFLSGNVVRRPDSQAWFGCLINLLKSVIHLPSDALPEVQ